MKKSDEFRAAYQNAYHNLRWGAAGRFLNDAFREVGAANVTPVLLETAKGVMELATKEFPFRVAQGVHSIIEVEGGILKPNSGMGGSMLTLKPDTLGRKDDFRFNMSIFSISGASGYFRTKALPISMRIDHVDERFAQRATGLTEQEMCCAMPYAMLLGQAVERRMLKRGEQKAPFAFPTHNGLLLGVAERVPQRTYHSEIDFYVASQSNTMIVPHKWNPQIDLKIFTFFGEGQMNPYRKKLHEVLQKFVVLGGSVESDAVTPAISDYIWVDHPAFPSPHNKDPLFIAAQESAERIVNSKLWNNAVQLPATMRGTKPGDNWRP